MLCVNNYTQEYIDKCRLKVGLQLSTYKGLLETVQGQTMADETSVNAAIESFNPVFYNNMVLILETLFAQRTIGSEKKDRNALNEVRIMSNSMMHNNNVLTADNTIEYASENSVLKYRLGDEIRLDETGFLTLFDAFFAEMESKFV